MDEKKPIVGPPGTFWVRAGALLLDVAILMAIFLVASIVLAIAVPLMAKGQSKETENLILFPVFTLVFVGIPCLYFTLSTAIWGMTIGKTVFNLRVSRLDGMPVSFFRSLWRWICTNLSSILGIGYIVAVLRGDKRSLHDLLSGTKVTQVKPHNQTLLVILLCLMPIGGVFITGILAAIAIPRFAQTLEKAREGATKGNLGALKSAASVYYTEHQGKWPADLEKGLVPKYIDIIPQVKATGAFIPKAESPAGNKVTPARKGEVPTKSGSGWLYDSILGNVYVNSTVKDSKGIPYSSYGFE